MNSANFVNCIGAESVSLVLQADFKTEYQSMEWKRKSSQIPEKYPLHKSRIKILFITF
jgi:hypothetical protein